MKVSDVMSRDIEYIAASDTVQAAAELMGEIEVGALPVGSRTHLDGIITDRDILYRLVARGHDPAATLVGDVLSRPVVTCRATDTIQSAMDLMATNHIRRLPVLDDTNHVAGWLTLADLARHLLVDSATLQTSLQAVTEPA